MMSNKKLRVFLAVLGITGSLIITVLLASRFAPSDIVTPKVEVPMVMFGKTTEIKDNRVDSEMSYRWVIMRVEDKCYPDIKKDLKEGLEKFGYYHTETSSLIHEKCREQDKLRNEEKFIERDQELMELVK